MKKRLLAMALCAVAALTLLPCLISPVLAAEVPEIHEAAGAYLYNFENDAVLYEMNPDERIYPASTVKLMTALVVHDVFVGRLTEKITVTKPMLDATTGRHLGLSAGEAISVEDLLYALLIGGYNDAANILAFTVSGSIEEFCTLMNAKAKELGLANTHFTNATGLYNENHYSTCREMAAIMAYALDNPLAKTVLTSFNGYSIKVYDSDTGKETRSLLVYTDWYSVRFKDNAKLKTVTVKGGKTGFVDESGISLVSYAETPDGKGYINVIVGQPAKSENYVNASTSTSEVKYIYNNYVK